MVFVAEDEKSTVFMRPQLTQLLKINDLLFLLLTTWRKRKLHRFLPLVWG